VARLGVVEEEADESIYWAELMVEAGLLNRDSAEKLLAECEEILRIVVASIKTARRG